MPEKGDPKLENDLQLYNMSLHEDLQVNKNLYVMRVAGGWIYREWFKNQSTAYSQITSTFVPDIKK